MTYKYITFYENLFIDCVIEFHFNLVGYFCKFETDRSFGYSPSIMQVLYMHLTIEFHVYSLTTRAFGHF